MPFIFTVVQQTQMTESADRGIKVFILMCSQCSEERQTQKIGWKLQCLRGVMQGTEIGQIGHLRRKDEQAYEEQKLSRTKYGEGKRLQGVKQLHKDSCM
jgi:hypothetical protein